MSNVFVPSGWKIVEIEKLLSAQSDGKLVHQGWSPQCDSEPAAESEWGVLKTTSIQDGHFLDHHNKRLPTDKKSKDRIEVRSGDLLITNAGPRNRCGVICYVRSTRSKLMLSGKMYRLRFPDNAICPEYIESWLRTSFVQKEINDRKTGISESGLNLTQAKFLTLPIMLSPLAEQKVIADKLDTLLAQVGTTKARLERIPEILKTFRQSVLAVAVSGELTEEWRKYIGQESVWSKTILLNVVESKPRNGWSPKGVDYATSIRNLTLSATTSGKFLNDKFKYIDTELSDDSYLWVKNGDILIQRANTIDYVGVSAIYTGTDNQYIYPDLMMKVTPSERILGDFLLYCLLENRTRKYFKDNATGTSGNMPKINQAVVSNTPIQLPSISEQTQIVHRVEELFAFADAIEQKAAAALERVNNLTQSILAKAFRGELTADWRAANPELISGENSAEALLAKIQAEREKLALEKKAVKKNRKQS